MELRSFKIFIGPFIVYIKCYFIIITFLTKINKLHYIDNYISYKNNTIHSDVGA